MVCGYRSPETNAMLRRKSSGVAKFSQHMLGHAMDFYIPGVQLDHLRAIGLRLQRGGVGFSAGSGSPFVHMDTGRIRMWPRRSAASSLSASSRISARSTFPPTTGRLPATSRRWPTSRSAATAAHPGSRTLKLNPLKKLLILAHGESDEEGIRHGGERRGRACGPRAAAFARQGGGVRCGRQG